MTMLTLKASGTFVRVAADGYAVAAVSQHLPDPEAYARVFAAAPDLLAALRSAERVLSDHGYREWIGGSIADLRAAIAKAEAE